MLLEKKNWQIRLFENLQQCLDTLSGFQSNFQYFYGILTSKYHFTNESKFQSTSFESRPSIKTSRKCGFEIELKHTGRLHWQCVNYRHTKTLSKTQHSSSDFKLIHSFITLKQHPSHILQSSHIKCLVRRFFRIRAA